MGSKQEKMRSSTPPDHLRSSTFPVFENLPSSGDFNDIQAVCASLMLARSAEIAWFLGMQRKVVKVLMLEQGGGGDV